MFFKTYGIVCFSNYGATDGTCVCFMPYPPIYNQLTRNTDYVISRDSDGIPTITKLTITPDDSWIINLSRLETYEMYMNIYPIIRSKSLIHIYPSIYTSPTNGDIWFDGSTFSFRQITKQNHLPQLLLLISQILLFDRLLIINYYLNSSVSHWMNGTGYLSTILEDVSILSPLDFQVFVYNSSRNQWVNSQALLSQSINDVMITNVQDEQLLVYNSTSKQWISKLGGLLYLSDGSITSPQQGQMLIYGSSISKWINSNVVTSLTVQSTTDMSSPAQVETILYDKFTLGTPIYTNTYVKLISTLYGYEFINDAIMSYTISMPYRWAEGTTMEVLLTLYIKDGIDLESICFTSTLFYSSSSLTFTSNKPSINKNNYVTFCIHNINMENYICNDVFRLDITRVCDQDTPDILYVVSVDVIFIVDYLGSKSAYKKC